MQEDKTTHFGYERIPLGDKQDRVDDVFHNVASRYDLMNDAMSLGVHRLWKRHCVAQMHLRPGQLVLDVAGGSGDMTKLIYPKICPGGEIILSDINASMLQVGQDRLYDAGICTGVRCMQLNAEQLPFSNTFDHIVIAFGLRNVPQKDNALQSFYQALKPGGRATILEFSQPTNPLFKTLYDQYSFKAIPKMGALFAKDEASYQYLVESIRQHPPQEQLKTMMGDAGFDDCRYENLTGGIVAIHTGFKY